MHVTESRDNIELIDFLIRSFQAYISRYCICNITLSYAHFSHIFYHNPAQIALQTFSIYHRSNFIYML